MAVTNRPKIEAYIGASGSGKGVSINRRLDEVKPSRLLIWDPRNEYPKHAKGCTSLSDVVAQVKAAKGGPFAVRYIPSEWVDMDQAFATMCALAFAAGNLLFLAEELSDVTKPSYAPAAWKKVITQGRHQGLHVIGAAQRPALVDKNFFGNCTYIRCFSLRYAEDRRAMGASMDVEQKRIDALMTTEAGNVTTINYIERDFREGLLQEGQIKLTRKG